ncbi:CPBP family intramembrane metalloprotease [Candidatus Thorarchaeota archaeon]|nr:MAG: CPBP family intramembrane metalloprotease [Candidatus Thorarchaeota archaeon]
MVIDDPDIHELKESESIGIFEPGKDIEREVDWDQLFRILVYVGAGFALTIALTFVILIPMLAAGLVTVDLVTMDIVFQPWSMLVLTFTELGFLLPPIYYARKRGFSLHSIGIKIGRPVKEVLLGLAFGVVMLIANLIITYLIVTYSGIPIEDEAGGFFTPNSPLETIAWIIVMFGVVGFSEEVLFRGFLQKRMDLYLRPKTNHYRLASLVVTSLIFSFAHLEFVGFAARFVLGLFLGYLCQRRNYSILGPTVAHGFNNAAVVVLASLGF